MGIRAEESRTSALKLPGGGGSFSPDQEWIGSGSAACGKSKLDLCAGDLSLFGPKNVGFEWGISLTKSALI